MNERKKKRRREEEGGIKKEEKKLFTPGTQKNPRPKLTQSSLRVGTILDQYSSLV